MSLLSIISGTDHGAAVLCGLPAPQNIINSLDPNTRLLLRLAQQEGRELARRHDWQALKVDYTFASTASEQQPAFPADFDRLLPQGELWDRTANLRYAGPVDDMTWGRLKGAAVNVAVPGYWRLLGGRLYLLPAPPAGHTLALPYMSSNWAESNNGTPKDSFTADTDKARIPERLIALGIVWRFKRAKGLDYADDMATYEREVERATARDRGLGPLILGKPRRDLMPPYTWPGTIIP